MQPGRVVMVMVLGAAFVQPPGAAADVWDLGAQNDDNETTTRNDVVHGLNQIHDLGDIVPGVLGDDDWFAAHQAPFSSYQVVVDGMTGDFSGIVIERLDRNGPIQQSVPIGAGHSQSLSWENPTVGPLSETFHITAGNVGQTVDDQYRVRFFDTTCAIARFNNGGSQLTIVIFENTTSDTVNGHYFMWSPSGAFSNPQTNSFTLAPHGMFLHNLAADPSSAISGSITVTNDSGYGAIVGKAIAFETSTGFLFDTPLVCRPF